MRKTTGSTRSVWRAVQTVLIAAAAAGLPTPADSATTRQQPATARSASNFARHVVAESDHQRLPFAVVDKRNASVAVFDARGTLVGESPALLGSALGDHSVPGAGERAQQGRFDASDSTTPAGRFNTHPGRNHTGEPIVWIDFDAALAIHRLRDDSATVRRSARLTSPHAAARRASAGCVVVPVAFYERVVQPLLGRSRAVVYVLHEDGRWPALWSRSHAAAF